VNGRGHAGRPGLGHVIERLVPESAVYGLGGAANQTVAIFLVPIYARQLGTSGVGISAIVNTTVALSLMLVSLALPQAFFRWFLSVASSDRDRANVLSTTMGLRVASSLLGAIAVAIAVVPLTILLYGSADNLPIFLVIPVIVFFDSLNSIPLSYLRAQRRARAYTLISFTRAALGTVLILGFVVGVGLGVMGIVLGSGISAVVCAGFGLYMLRGAHLRWGLDRDLARAMLAFSLPLVPAAAAGWALNLSDRYILQALTDADVVGVYALGYTGGMVVLAFVVQPFVLAWAATSWEIAKEDDAPRQFARVLTAFTVVAAFVGLAISALATDVIRLLIGPAFEDSRLIVPFSAFAYVLYGAYSVAAIGLNITSQTRWISLAMGVAAATSIGLNLVLIPMIGFIGAGLATLLSYALLAIVTASYGQRYYPIPWDVVRVGATMAIGLALAAAALVGPDHTLWRIGTIAVFPFVLVAARIVSIDEIRAASRLIRRGGRGAPE
jgi:O-antigen/teichoic acid export membrane protein